MPICINDDGAKRTCCCGCSLTCGVLTFAILAGLDGVNKFITSDWIGGGIDVFLLIVGVAAVMQKT